MNKKQQQQNRRNMITTDSLAILYSKKSLADMFLPTKICSKNVLIIPLIYFGMFSEFSKCIKYSLSKGDIMKKKKKKH